MKKLLKEVLRFIVYIAAFFGIQGCSALDFECHGEYCIKASK